MRLIRAALIAVVVTLTFTPLTLAQWPTTCVELNDIVEAHLGNYNNVGIYQRVFGNQAEQACQNDHRDDVRSVFAWAIGSEVQPTAPTPAPTPAVAPVQPPTDHSSSVADLWAEADFELGLVADVYDFIQAECDNAPCMAGAMEVAAETCDIAASYIADIVALSSDPDWLQVQLHVTDYCDGLYWVVELLDANQVQDAGLVLDDALASLALAWPYLQRLVGN